MFGIAGTVELSTFYPGTGTWNRLQDGIMPVRCKAHAVLVAARLDLPGLDTEWPL